MDRETLRHDCKDVGSDAKHQCKQTKLTQNNKRDAHAVVCVYWYTGLSLACYLENIHVIYAVDENIIQNSVCLASNDVVFSSEFEKIALQKTTT